jgi:hypothetical protein
MPKKKKQPTKKMKLTKKTRKRELEGYYIPGDGTIKTLYKNKTIISN